MKTNLISAEGLCKELRNMYYDMDGVLIYLKDNKEHDVKWVEGRIKDFMKILLDIEKELGES